MVKIKEAIVVEGRYDKNTLCQIVDAPILETSGFGIFKDKKRMDLFRKKQKEKIRKKICFNEKLRCNFQGEFPFLKQFLFLYKP